MAVQAANNVANTPRNNPVQEVNEQGRQQQPAVSQNPENRDENRDNYVQSPEAERVRELTGRREELQGAIATEEQVQNDVRADFARGNEIRSEIDDIDREIKNIEPRENDAVNRAQREALNTYAEQNQAVIRTRNITQGVTNPTGE